MDLEDSSSPDIAVFKGIREEENEESSPEKSKTTLNNDQHTFTDMQNKRHQIQKENLDKSSNQSKNSTHNLNPHLQFDQISESSMS